MSAFADYFYDLATRIFKRKPKAETDIYKLTEALGPAYDDSKEQILSIRHQAMVMLATGISLDYHGADRKMPRYSLESDDDYRSRLLSAFPLYQQGGTEPGMKYVLDSLGYFNSTIYQLYKEKYKWSADVVPVALTVDARAEYLGKWAQFVIILNLIGGRTLTQLQSQILKDSINRVKPAEGKLYHIINYMSAEKIALEEHIYTAQITRGMRLGTTWHLGVTPFAVKGAEVQIK